MNELVNDGIKLSKLEINTGFINRLPKKWLAFCQSLRNTNHVKESELASLFGKLKYEENLINSIYDTNQEKTLIPTTPLSTAFFSSSIVQDFQDTPDDEEDTRSMSSDDNEVTKVKALIALTNEERVFVGKESARNGDWIKISMKKVHTLLEMEDNDDRKSFLDYLCIDLNYIEEHINNLMSKHRNLIQELNTCKEQFSVLKQAKLDLLTMQHVNTEILKENQNLRNELKELTSITEAWLNNSNKVNQCTRPDLNGEVVNESQCRGTIGSLLNLTASRPDIQFSTDIYARHQANIRNPTLFLLRIFRYLNGTSSLSLHYPKRSGLDLKGYRDSDCAGCNMDKKKHFRCLSVA
ncbi:hypothetical protein Tco_0511621 [Tanacetum coccineum]